MRMYVFLLPTNGQPYETKTGEELAQSDPSEPGTRQEIVAWSDFQGTAEGLGKLNVESWNILRIR